MIAAAGTDANHICYTRYSTTCALSAAFEGVVEWEGSQGFPHSAGMYEHATIQFVPCSPKTVHDVGGEQGKGAGGAKLDQ